MCDNGCMSYGDQHGAITTPDKGNLTEFDRLARELGREEMLANFIYRRERYMKTGRVHAADSLGRAISRLEQTVNLPSNAKWLVTPGRNSPEEYKGRVFIYDSYEKAKEDAEAICGKVSMAEYVGDGELDK